MEEHLKAVMSSIDCQARRYTTGLPSRTARKGRDVGPVLQGVAMFRSGNWRGCWGEAQRTISREREWLFRERGMDSSIEAARAMEGKKRR